MSITGYTTLTRQSGLFREMRVLANNIANAGTTGFRQEGLVFSEFVRRAGADPSISMATARIGITSFQQGALQPTGGTFDLGIEGDGFFIVETAQGERLTRAGAFQTNAQGDLVTPDGLRVLDAGGAPVFIPPDVTAVSVSRDGTIAAGDRLLGQIGLVAPTDAQAMVRQGSTLFEAAEGWDPVPNPQIAQGFLEHSNVSPITQLARMIEVQRAYELGQSFLDAEDQRKRTAIQTFIE